MKLKDKIELVQQFIITNMQNDKTSEELIIEACDELSKALIAQHRNFISQEKLKIEEIKLRQMVLKAREKVADLRNN